MTLAQILGLTFRAPSLVPPQSNLPAVVPSGLPYATGVGSTAWRTTAPPPGSPDSAWGRITFSNPISGAGVASLMPAAFLSALRSCPAPPARSAASVALARRP